MKHTTEIVTRKDVLTAVQNYLTARKQEHPNAETIGSFLYHLYKSDHPEEEIEQTSIDITQAMAVFCNPEVRKLLVEHWGEYAMSRFCDFLASLNKVLLYMAACKTAMTSVSECYWNEAEIPDNVPEPMLRRIKREYEIRLQRLQDGEDFE